MVSRGTIPFVGFRHSQSLQKFLNRLGAMSVYLTVCWDVLVREVVLQGSRIVTIIGQLEPARMAKHVRVDGEWQLGGLPEALDKPVETDGADWPAALGNEYVGVCRVIAA